MNGNECLICLNFRKPAYGSSIFSLRGIVERWIARDSSKILNARNLNLCNCSHMKSKTPPLSFQRSLRCAVCFALAAAVSSFACQAGEPAKKSAKPKKPKMEQKSSEPQSTKKKVAEEKVQITGSRIPQKINRVGNTTDGTLYVNIYDAEEYRKSGRPSLVEFLRSKPSNR
jgi:hypothetical protein